LGEVYIFTQSVIDTGTAELLSILKGVSELNIPCEGSREEFYAHAKESLGSRLLQDCQQGGD
jgi:hypothetical protein